MAQTSKTVSGYLVFGIVTALVFVGCIALQTSIAEWLFERVFQRSVLYADVLPGKWIIMNRIVTADDPGETRRAEREDVFRKIKNREYYRDDAGMNELAGKLDLLNRSRERQDTVYFINPTIAFFPIYLAVSFLVAFAVSLFLSGGGSLGIIRASLLRTYERMEFMLRKQCESHQLAFDPLTRLSPEERERAILNSTLPEVTVNEMADFLMVREWLARRRLNPLIPLKFYFRYRLSDAYGNLIQGLVAGGAAILIFVIGLRGIKFIPAEEPSLILMGLSLEFVLLVVLMFTFAGSAQEERLDRVVKELEAQQREAIQKQTETLHEIFENMREESERAGDGESFAAYEERRLLDSVISVVLHGKRGKDGGER
ncbi:MAG: hypothetical protein QHI48_06935 [Bacteroidota bacterium]|nr:hypothetical protein [Bacteroidota bacterium]